MLSSAGPYWTRRLNRPWCCSSDDMRLMSSGGLAELRKQEGPFLFEGYPVKALALAPSWDSLRWCGREVFNFATQLMSIRALILTRSLMDCTGLQEEERAFHSVSLLPVAVSWAFFFWRSDLYAIRRHSETHMESFGGWTILSHR